MKTMKIGLSYSRILLVVTLTSLAIIVSSIIHPAYAEVTSLQTSSSFYQGNNVIQFSGTTLSTDPPNVTILIFDPNNKFILLASGITDSNHTFQVSVDTGLQSNKFSLKGIYNATAFVANQASGRTVSFVFSPDINATASVIESKVKAIAVSTSSIVLSFNEPVNTRNPYGSFKIDRSNDGGNTWTTIKNSGELSGEVISTPDTGLFPNTPYTYRIFAVTVSGESTLYATTSATTFVPTIGSGYFKISTDKSIYTFGDQIIISGKVLPVNAYPNFGISVSSTALDWKVYSNTTSVNPDGTFLIRLQSMPSETWLLANGGEGSGENGIYNVCLWAYSEGSGRCLDQTSFTMNYNKSSPPKITIMPIYSNNYVNFTVTVSDTSSSPTTPTGSVSWSDGSPTSCTLSQISVMGHCPIITVKFNPTSCTLSSGSCSVTYTPDESSSTPIHISAYYDGDTIHRSNIGFFTLNVTNLRNVPPSPLPAPILYQNLTNNFTHQIPVGSHPAGVAYDSGKGEVFVSNTYDGTVSAISDITNTVVATIPVGSANNIAYDSGKGEVFVTGTGTVSVISDATNTVVATIPIEAEPIGIAYDSGKSEIFVTTYADNGDMVSVISDATNTVITTIPIGPPAADLGIAYDSGKSEIFVTLYAINSNTVSVISDITNTVVAAVPIGGIPSGIAYDSGKGEIFVTNTNFQNRASTISVISDATNTVITTIPVRAFPMGIAYDSGKSEIFVISSAGNDNTISVIRDSDNTVVATTPIETNPVGIAYDSGKSKIFVTNTMGTVSVISDNAVPSVIIPPTNTQPTSTFTPTQQDIQNINQAKASKTIAAEVNVGTNQTQTTSIDNNVSIQTTSNTPDSLNVNVSASSQIGPKVIVFNLNTTTINVANLKDLGVMYDGKPISPAPNMDAILHAKPTDNPSFAIVVTQSGVQVLVLVPHFSTHTITITNMPKIMTTTIPEFPFAVIVLVIAILSIVVIPKIRR